MTTLEKRSYECYKYLFEWVLKDFLENDNNLYFNNFLDVIESSNGNYEITMNFVIPLDEENPKGSKNIEIFINYKQKVEHASTDRGDEPVVRQFVDVSIRYENKRLLELEPSAQAIIEDYIYLATV